MHYLGSAGRGVTGRNGGNWKGKEEGGGSAEKGMQGRRMGKKEGGIGNGKGVWEEGREGKK